MKKLILFCVLALTVIACKKDKKDILNQPPNEFNPADLEFYGDNTYTDDQDMDCQLFYDLYIGKRLDYTSTNFGVGSVTFNIDGSCTNHEGDAFQSWKYNTWILGDNTHTFCNYWRVQFKDPQSGEVSEKQVVFSKYYDWGGCKAGFLSEPYFFTFTIH